MLHGQDTSHCTTVYCTACRDKVQFYRRKSFFSQSLLSGGHSCCLLGRCPPVASQYIKVISAQAPHIPIILYPVYVFSAHFRPNKARAFDTTLLYEALPYCAQYHPVLCLLYYDYYSSRSAALAFELQATTLPTSV